MYVPSSVLRVVRDISATEDTNEQLEINFSRSPFLLGVKHLFRRLVLQHLCKLNVTGWRVPHKIMNQQAALDGGRKRSVQWGPQRID